jgi:hypothetical protein
MGSRRPGKKRPVAGRGWRRVGLGGRDRANMLTCFRPIAFSAAALDRRLFDAWEF